MGFFAGKSPSSFAGNPSANAIRKALERAGKKVNEPDYQGRSALMMAAHYNWRSATLLLVQLKADVNAVTKSNKCALHFAVPHRKDVAKILIDAQANVNCQEDDPDFDPEYTSKTFGDRKEHRTPLHIAAESGDTETASLLLSAGAEVDIRDAQYKTALHLAIDEKNAEMIDLLLVSKADVNLGNLSSGMRNSPLMGAAHVQDLALVKKVLAAKASVNQQ